MAHVSVQRVVPNPEITYHIWRSSHRSFLFKHFWKEHTFWSDGYFVCSIGEASPDTIREYILSQG